MRPGKGSHTRWSHALITGRLTLSGHDGDDADHYQEEQVATVIATVAEAQRSRTP